MGKRVFEIDAEVMAPAKAYLTVIADNEEEARRLLQSEGDFRLVRVEDLTDVTEDWLRESDGEDDWSEYGSRIYDLELEYPDETDIL